MTAPTTGRRRTGLWIGLAVGIVIVIVGLALFQPWKLFVNKTVDEALPGVATGAPATTGAGAGSASTTSSGSRGAGAPSTAGGGRFQSYAHQTSGELKVVKADGKTYVRFENFKTDNGPDLVVYLSPTASTGPEGSFADNPVNLGELKGNVGNQNYEVPAGTDLSKYRSVVVWCKRFSVAFGAAPLTTT